MITTTVGLEGGTVPSVVLAGRALSQSSLEPCDLVKTVLPDFGLAWGLSPPSFSPISPFRNGNVYPMSVLPLQFEGAYLFGLTSSQQVRASIQDEWFSSLIHT